MTKYTLTLLVAFFLFSAQASQSSEKKDVATALTNAHVISLVSVWGDTLTQQKLPCGCKNFYGDTGAFTTFFYTMLEQNHPASTLGSLEIKKTDIREAIIKGFFDYLLSKKALMSTGPCKNEHPSVDHSFKNYFMVTKMVTKNEALKPMLNTVMTEFDVYARTMESIIKNHGPINSTLIKPTTSSIQNDSAEYHHVSGALNVMAPLWNKRVIVPCSCAHIQSDNTTISRFLNSVVFNNPHYDESFREKVIQALFLLLKAYNCVFDDNQLAENYHPTNNSTIAAPWRNLAKDPAHSNNKLVRLIINEFKNLEEKNIIRFQQNQCPILPTDELTQADIDSLLNDKD